MGQVRELGKRTESKQSSKKVKIGCWVGVLVLMSKSRRLHGLFVGRMDTKRMDCQKNGCCMDGLSDGWMLHG